VPWQSTSVHLITFVVTWQNFSTTEVFKGSQVKSKLNPHLETVHGSCIRPHASVSFFTNFPDHFMRKQSSRRAC
jgi:hypothetical protein